MYTCRECERPINQGTELCPYCGADLTADLAMEPAVPENRRRVLMRRAIFWGVTVLGLWGVLWVVLPESRPFGSDAAAEAEAQAVAALRDVQHALQGYAEAQGGFPASLDALGQAELARARAAAQKAQGQGYRIEYVAGLPEPDGAVRTFRLLARPGHYGYRNFFVNETGVVRHTRENRAATAEDKPL
jgi:hypothetical protein